MDSIHLNLVSQKFHSSMSCAFVHQRIYAVGDIHGCLAQLKHLLVTIEEDRCKHPLTQDVLIFLGDYLDRGTHSKEVIELLLHGLPANIATHFIRGNHEEIILRILGGDLVAARGWLQFGGRQTLLSYGVNLPVEITPQIVQELNTVLVQKIPQEHLDFLAATKLYLVLGDYCFVHAGIKPNVAIENQTSDDVLWIRQEFLESEIEHEKIIVHGHTITDKPDIRSNRIGIDTGAYATGHLTCLVLHGHQRYILQT